MAADPPAAKRHRPAASTPDLPPCRPRVQPRHYRARRGQQAGRRRPARHQRERSVASGYPVPREHARLFRPCQARRPQVHRRFQQHQPVRRSPDLWPNRRSRDPHSRPGCPPRSRRHSRLHRQQVSRRRMPAQPIPRQESLSWHRQRRPEPCLDLVARPQVLSRDSRPQALAAFAESPQSARSRFHPVER